MQSGAFNSVAAELALAKTTHLILDALAVGASASAAHRTAHRTRDFLRHSEHLRCPDRCPGRRRQMPRPMMMSEDAKFALGY
jgi:hypothetical protein